MKDFGQSVPSETIVHIIEDTLASRPFSRHGITRASSVLPIWLNENVPFLPEGYRTRQILLRKIHSR